MSEQKKPKYGSASIPRGVLEEIEKLIKELRFWPSRSAFIREACIEKIRREQDRLKKLKEATSRAPWEKVLEEKSK